MDSDRHMVRPNNGSLQSISYNIRKSSVWMKGLKCCTFPNVI